MGRQGRSGLPERARRHTVPTRSDARAPHPPSPLVRPAAGPASVSRVSTCPASDSRSVPRRSIIAWETRGGVGHDAKVQQVKRISTGVVVGMGRRMSPEKTGRHPGIDERIMVGAGEQRGIHLLVRRPVHLPCGLDRQGPDRCVRMQRSLRRSPPGRIEVDHPYRAVEGVAVQPAVVGRTAESAFLVGKGCEDQIPVQALPPPAHLATSMRLAMPEALSDAPTPSN